MAARAVRMNEPVFSTARLRLRRFALSDAPFIVRLLNQPSFIEHIGDRGVRTEADARLYLQNGPIASYAAHGFGLWLAERLDTGEPTGMCGLLKRETLADADLGYAFMPEHWGQGLASEAARATLAHAHRALGLCRVVAIVGPGNARSIRLLGELGFRLEGAAPESPIASGAPTSLLYAWAAKAQQ